MKEIFVKDSELRKAAQEGMDEFVGVFYNAISDAVGGQLTAENMAGLTPTNSRFGDSTPFTRKLWTEDLYNLSTTATATSFSSTRLQRL